MARRMYKRNDANSKLINRSISTKEGRIGFDLITAKDEAHEKELLEQGWVERLHEITLATGKKGKEKVVPVDDGVGTVGSVGVDNNESVGDDSGENTVSGDDDLVIPTTEPAQVPEKQKKGKSAVAPVKVSSKETN